MKGKIREYVKSYAFIINFYKVCKSFLSKILFKLLIKLDSSIIDNSFLNSVNNIEKNSIILTTSSILANKSGREHILVMNEDGLVANKQMFLSLIDAAFFYLDQSCNDFLKFKENLLNYFYEKKIYLVNQKEILQNIKHYIEKLEHTPLVLKLKSALCLYENDIFLNSTAYSTINKLNPNAVYWPDPSDSQRPRSLFTESPSVINYGMITKDTPIGSAGSCFAMEIAHKLQNENFNYIIEEREKNPIRPPEACARWGIIFNTPSFLQLIERSFETRVFPKIISSGKINGKTVYADPFRMGMNFDSIEEYELDSALHIEAARRALLKVEFFVITLGVNEIWYFKSDGSVFSFAPWRISPGLIGHKVMSMEENVADLQKMLDIWRVFNPNIKLIVTVSPVPLHATFRGNEQHIIVANSHSKAVLRVAAEEFVKRNKNVFYFPSYEVVMHCTPNPWDVDQRHVSRGAVDNVMSLFNKMFVKN